MKRTLTLTLVALGLATGTAFLLRSAPPAHRNASGLAATPPPMASVAATAITPAPAAAAQYKAPVFTAAQPAPRMQSGEHRLPRTAINQVLPGLTGPVTDWRTFAPERLTITPLPGMPLEFTVKSVTTDGKRTTWIGFNEVQGASLVASATETLWDAIITVPGAEEYSVQVTPELVRVFERDHSDSVCGQVETRSFALLAAAATHSPLAAGTAAATDSTTLHTSDLLVLYDSGTMNDWGSAAETENRIAAVVTAMNVYLEQSKVDNLRWHLAGTALVPAYTATNSLEDDLKRLADSKTELGRFALQQRTLVGADQVQLIVAGTRDYAGIAHTPGYFSVVHHPGTSATAAHELGHNFGCMHDRQTETAQDNDGHYYYGHRFTYNSQDIGTIMSYAPYLVPYFSNPTITYEGNPVGVAAGQPKAADNARWLREHAANIADLVPTKTVTTPTITSQPSSVTVTAGQSFTLSVTATGNSLSYQWLKNGVAITGATSASFAKTAAATTDSGSYTVQVRNTAGSVTSNAATVTVNAAPVTPTTPTTSSGGGGGGGGSFGLLSALGVLALLAAGRRHSR